MDATVSRCEKIGCPEHRRGRGRRKKSWREVIRYDLNTLGLVEDMAVWFLALSLMDISWDQPSKVKDVLVTRRRRLKKCWVHGI